MTRWIALPCRVSSAVTEVTRNGMSSVTIWTRLRGDSQRSASDVGVDLTTVLPVGRFAANRRCPIAKSESCDGSRARMSSAATWR